MQKAKSIIIILILLLSMVILHSDEYHFTVHNTPAGTPQEFFNRYRMNGYLNNVSFDVTQARNWDVVSRTLKISQDQIAKLKQNGFFVTPNIISETFGTAYRTLFQQHLPLFVTTDSVLHALHCSFDEILKEVEVKYISKELNNMLKTLSVFFEKKTYPNNEINKARQELVTYFSVSRALLLGLKNSQNPSVNKYLRLVYGQNMHNQIELFGDKRPMDFSQFIPRGHYTKSKALKKYFRGMMWLGQIYFKISNKHQTIMALLTAQALSETKTLAKWNEINSIINMFVGKSDNATPEDLLKFANKYSISENILVNANEHQKMLANMKKDRFGVPKIMGTAIMDENAVKQFMQNPVFYFYGQRFTLDASVLQSTAWYPERPLPQAEDVAFAMGSNEAADVLKKDINRIGKEFIKRIENARKIIAFSDSSLYRDTIYHKWLKTLSQLFLKQQDLNNNNLPDMMRTRAWGYLKMNTMLASYSQLKHDTILYSKPVYMGGVCEYPDAYVEPNPAFFNELKKLGESTAQLIKNLNVEIGELKERWISYFINFARINGILARLAQKELNAEPFNFDESSFLKSAVATIYVEPPGYGGMQNTEYDGWYYRLFYHVEDALKVKYEIADIANFTFKQQTLYIASGLVNYGVFAVNCRGKLGVYVGPVYQFYQFNHPMTDRLTDERWEEIIKAQKHRSKMPQWSKFFISKNNETFFNEMELRNPTVRQINWFSSDTFRIYTEEKLRKMKEEAERYKKQLNDFIGSSVDFRRPEEPGVLRPFTTNASQEDVFSTDPITQARYVHGTYCLFDNDVRTAWVVNKNRGIGAWINLFYAEKKKINKLAIRGGFDFIDPKYGDLFMKNNRLKKILVEFFSGTDDNTRVHSQTLEFDGVRGFKEFAFNNIQAMRIKITILEVYSGSKYPKDTCVSEMKIYGQ